jgi:hypothetical protein
MFSLAPLCFDIEIAKMLQEGAGIFPRLGGFLLAALTLRLAWFEIVNRPLDDGNEQKLARV